MDQSEASIGRRRLRRGGARDSSKKNSKILNPEVSRKMKAAETPVAHTIPRARSDKFNCVTNVGTKCCTQLTQLLKKDPTADELADGIRTHVPEVLQTLIEVIFQKTGIWDRVDKEDELAWFRDMKYDTWVNPIHIDQDEIDRQQVK